MSSGLGRPVPAVGGNSRTMAAGMGVVAAGLLSFYFGQFRAHKSDNQTWIWLHGQQPGRVEGSRLVDNTLTAEPVPRPDIPVRGDTGANGKDGLVATLMSLNLGKGLFPDRSVPEHPGNIQQPAPSKRRNDAGRHYSKAGEYVDSYIIHPEHTNSRREARERQVREAA